jgi:hypothetical protein
MLVNVNIGSNPTGAYKDVAIKFPTPFGDVLPEIPHKIIVVATVELPIVDNYTDRYCVNVANVTNEGFLARVARIDGDEGWGMDLTLNYSANSCTVFNQLKGE